MTFLSFFNWHPTEKYSSVFQIDYNRWYQSGIRYLFFDLEQTLMPLQKKMEIPLKTQALIKDLKEKGFQCFSYTNQLRSPILEKLSEQLEIPLIYFCLKPIPWILDFFIKTRLKVSKEICLIIGDQLFTDIWLANLLNCRSIWVVPMDPQADGWYAGLRFLEKQVL